MTEEDRQRIKDPSQKNRRKDESVLAKEREARYKIKAVDRGKYKA